MSNILQSLNRTVIAGILLAFIFFLLLLSIWPGSSDWFSDRYFWSAIFNFYKDWFMENNV